MIETLTTKQEQQLIEFRDECLSIGLSTSPLDKTEHRNNIDYIYKTFLRIDKHPHIWYCDSPLMYNLVINTVDNLQDNLRANLQDNLRANLWANLRDNLWANLRANLQDNLRANLWANLQDNLWANLRANLQANLRANLWANLRANLQDNLRANLWANLGDKTLFYNVYWGNWDISWLSFYVFPQKYLGIRYPEAQQKSLEQIVSLISNSGCLFFHKDICFITSRPIEIHKKGIQLHNDKKPALLYKDGYCLWMLNGVAVPKWLVEIRETEIEPQRIKECANAEVRREFVRKIGIDRICYKLNAKCIDKSGNYELLLLDIGDKTQRPYLKMLNPSIGTWHVEGIHPDCKSVEQALNWRNSSNLKPIILT